MTAFFVGLVTNNPWLFILGGIGLMVTIPVVFGSFISIHILNGILVSHLWFHRGREIIHSMETEHVKPLPSFLEMVGRMTLATLGLLSYAVSGGGILPKGIVDLETNVANVLPLYIVSSVLAIGLSLALWLLESTGATCLDRRLGKVNLGALVSLFLSGILGFSALAHYLALVYQMNGISLAVQVSLILTAAISIGCALFSTWFIRKFVFNRMSIDAQRNVEYLLSRFSSANRAK